MSKAGGVNRLLIVFLTAGTKEDYTLFVGYLKGLKLRRGEWTLCGDYKVKSKIRMLPSRLIWPMLEVNGLHSFIHLLIHLRW